MTPLSKQWEAPVVPPAEYAAALSDIPPFVRQILYGRGVADRPAVDAFLDGQADPLVDPFLMKGMRTAAERILQAVASRERVVVYGDFDADGVTSTALLVHALRRLGTMVEPYIPDRVDEGYGLSLGAIEKLADRGTTLVVTVDCGVSSVDEIALAVARGMDVIVTDHHHSPANLPPALAIVNPKQTDCPYPFKALAGVGVAFKVAQAVASLAGDAAIVEWMDQLTDLVALGTVADLVPLVGENRTLVKRGLCRLNHSERPGIRALLRVARLGKVDSGALAFALGPRLNAAGRMGDAWNAYHILLTQSASEASELATALESANLERQRLTAELCSLARAQLLESGPNDKIAIVGGAEYRAGVVGLVAGRLADEFYRPAIVLETGTHTSRGSARSIPGFHIARALEQCDDLLVRHGGHAQAAGFTVDNSLLDELKQRLLEIAERELSGEATEPALAIDAELEAGQIRWDTLDWLDRLAPFGYGNQQPLLVTRRLRLCGETRLVGRDPVLQRNHLKARFVPNGGGQVVEAIGFRMGGWLDELPKHPLWDVAYCMERNQWGDNPETLQMNVKDLRPSLP
jgi:single-stranded-DNA-specific exonuclease